MHETRIVSVLFYDSNIVCIPTTSSYALPTPALLNSVNSKKEYGIQPERSTVYQILL
jgi:hypothetical protein